MKTSLRWAVPAVAAAVVAGVAVLPSASAGDRPSDLSPRTAAQLLADLGSARTAALSGTVVQTSRLGLPELPGSEGGTGPESLASGSNTLRVWVDGAERQRVALLGTLAEYDVVRSGRDVWTYSSSKGEAVHHTLPERRAAEPVVPTSPTTTPADAAAAALAAIDPSTAVTTQTAVRVAGRSARQLVLTPRDTTSLVGSVRLAVDAATSAPLRVQVLARGASTPAFEVGFTDVTFTRPDASVFAFTAPPGATVVEKAAPTARSDRARGTAPAVSTLGTGWSRIVVLSDVDLTPAQQQQAAQLTRRVPEGQLLTTALVSALLTDEGRLLVGAVTPEALRAAA